MLMLMRESENRDGKKYNDPKGSEDMKSKNRGFSRAHVMSIHLKLLAIGATIWYGFRLASRMELMVTYFGGWKLRKATDKSEGVAVDNSSLPDPNQRLSNPCYMILLSPADPSTDSLIHPPSAMDSCVPH